MSFKLTRKKCNHFHIEEQNRCIVCRETLKCVFSPNCVSIIPFLQFEHLKYLILTHLWSFGNRFSRKNKLKVRLGNRLLKFGPIQNQRIYIDIIGRLIIDNITSTGAHSPLTSIYKKYVGRYVGV